MNADKFAKAVRGGNDKFRADDLVIDTVSEKLTGKGYLLVQSTKLIIQMTLDAGTKSPDRRGSGVVTTSDYWTMTGTIDHDLRFKSKCGPVFTQRFHDGVVTLEKSVGPIELEVKGWDRLTSQERKERWKKIAAIHGKSATEADPEPAETGSRTNNSFEFHADFVDYKLRFADEVTHTDRKNPFFGSEGGGWTADTLMGETSSYKFGLIQADENDDLRLVIRSKENQPPLSEAEHLRKYHAFCSALSFVHGINAWQYRLRYWRAGALSSDQISAAAPAPRSHHTPFSEFNHELEMGGFLSKIAEFLEPNSWFNDELTSMMHLFRQTGSTGELRKVDSLVYCALLEGLTKLLFTELSLSAPQQTGQFADFETRKTELLAHLDGLANPSDSTRRLRQAVSSAQPTKPLKIEKKFEMVCNHLGLRWEGRMKVVKDAWDQVRNDFAHGDFREGASITEEVQKADILAESRIAGGFNIILLKLFGYSGPYKPSVYEPEDDRL